MGPLMRRRCSAFHHRYRRTRCSLAIPRRSSHTGSLPNAVSAIGDFDDGCPNQQIELHGADPIEVGGAAPHHCVMFVPDRSAMPTPGRRCGFRISILDMARVVCGFAGADAVGSALLRCMSPALQGMPGWWALTPLDRVRVASREGPRCAFAVRSERVSAQSGSPLGPGSSSAPSAFAALFRGVRPSLGAIGVHHLLIGAHTRRREHLWPR